MNRKLWENLASLYSVHVLNYVVPMLTLPFLTRVLGPKSWGMLAFAEAYANYVGSLVEYGFGLSASRHISEHRDSPYLRGKQLSAVIGAQILLALSALLVAAPLSWIAPSMTPYRAFLPLALALGVCRAAMPVWYFLGLERMRMIAILNIVSNAAAAAAIFATVKGPGDTAKPLIIRTVFALFATAIAFSVAYRDTPVVRITARSSRDALASGWSLFLYKSAVTLYTTANVLLIGFFAPATSIAWFAGAEKIAKAATSAVSPIMQSFYPRLAYLLPRDKRAANEVMKASILITMLAGSALGLMLLGLAPYLVKTLLGQGFGPSVHVLRLLAVLPPLIAASNVLGMQWMFAFKMEKQVNRVIMAAGAANIVLSIILAPRFLADGMAISVDCAESLVTVALIVVAYRSRNILFGEEPIIQARAS